ncbi:tetratricopeptide repeat protein [Marinigracilibium pacificum]|uniref:Tetratricopeptide repeat protein n=1 Tax=Marinigracilibium pacificum TaxID=2729599 RepID=A0A848J2S0_9BACT|nr:tetratricopeptide repeat protein [Marinigracilibium pacificum]NMM47472.1 tetratricopeptide repeat protein [Marinigracilibium pacificum]
MKHSILSTLLILLFFNLNGQSLLNEGKLALADNDNEKAEAIFKQVYSNDSSDKQALYYLGYTLYISGKLNEAQSLIDKGLVEDSTNTKLLNLGIKISSKRDFYEKAMDYNIRWCQLDSGNAQAYSSLGNLAAKVKLPGLMMNAWEIALQNNPKDLDLRSRLADLYLELNMPEYADSVVSIGFFQDPDNRRLKKIKAKAAYDLKQYEVVIDVTNEFINEEILNLNMLQLNSFSLYNIGKYEEALPLIESLIENSKPIPALFYLKGVCLKETGQNAEAIKAFEQTIKHSYNDKIGSYYATLGKTYEENGEMNKAIASYKRATEFDTEDIIIYQLARTCDVYYKDKTPALNYYSMYAERFDTLENRAYHEFALQRISEIKENRFMEAKEISPNIID